MKSFQQSMEEYQSQLQKGSIQQAYKGLMNYFNSLRIHFTKKYPAHFVSGLYCGYMDMTYFSFTPSFLKNKKLKVAIVFIHEAFQFEVWLSGSNKTIQTKYWKLIKESNWKKYTIPITTKGVDSIIENIIVDRPDFSNLNKLTQRIEEKTLEFIQEVEEFLSKRSA